MANTEGKGHKDGGYGLGWVVIPEKQDFGNCYHQTETVFHDGMFLILHITSRCNNNNNYNNYDNNNNNLLIFIT